MSIVLNGTTGITSTGITETSDGEVGIGTSSPARKLSVYDTSSIPVRIETNTSDTKIEILTTSGTQFIQGSANNLIFGTNNIERARILPSGGITFNGDTAEANALDDYEEGTWTPSLTGGTVFGQGAWDIDVITGLNVSHARYTKIGEMVTLYYAGKFTGTAEDIVMPCNRSIFGLPFVPIGPGSGAMNSDQGVGTFHVYSSLGSGYFATGATMCYQGGLTLTVTGLSGTFGNINEVFFTFTYRTAS